jgi:hypothetical protein
MAVRASLMDPASLGGFMREQNYSFAKGVKGICDIGSIALPNIQGYAKLAKPIGALIGCWTPIWAWEDMTDLFKSILHGDSFTVMNNFIAVVSDAADVAVWLSALSMIGLTAARIFSLLTIDFSFGAVAFIGRTIKSWNDFNRVSEDTVDNAIRTLRKTQKYWEMNANGCIAMSLAMLTVGHLLACSVILPVAALAITGAVASYYSYVYNKYIDHYKIKQAGINDI